MKWLMAVIFVLCLTSTCFSDSFYNDKDVLNKAIAKMDDRCKKALNDLQEGTQIKLSFFKDMDKVTKVNFATAYARECSKKKLWLEIVEVLDFVKDDVNVCADPACYYFTKATAEFMLGRKEDTLKSLGLMSEASIITRYNNLADLMIADMEQWKQDDLGSLSRKMQEITDRLNNGQGGKKTQKMQREILAKLDEMIKKKENDKKNKNQNQECPSGGEDKEEGQNVEKQNGNANNNRIDDPATESHLPQGQGRGEADKKSDKKLVQDWGNLPEKERAIAQLGLERRIAAKYKNVVKTYMQSINDKSEK